jgi:hypothetical protein
VLGPSLFSLSTVASTVTSALAVRSAADRSFALVAASITGVEVLLLLLILALVL